VSISPLAGTAVSVSESEQLGALKTAEAADSLAVKREETGAALRVLKGGRLR
jgi:hypothetical protein